MEKELFHGVLEVPFRNFRELFPFRVKRIDVGGGGRGVGTSRFPYPLLPLPAPFSPASRTLFPVSRLVLKCTQPMRKIIKFSVINRVNFGFYNICNLDCIGFHWFEAFCFFQDDYKIKLLLSTPYGHHLSVDSKLKLKVIPKIPGQIQDFKMTKMGFIQGTKLPQYRHLVLYLWCRIKYY